MKNRKITIFVLLSLVLSMLLIACAPSEKDNNSTGNNSADESTGDTSGTTSADINIPELDLGGRTITFLVPDSTYSYYESFEIYAEELTEELLNDEVYNRNKIVEEKFKCEIVAVKGNAIHETLRNDNQANANDYDIFMPHLHDAIGLAADGYLYDLLELDNFNLTQPYWDQKFNENLTLGGKLYFSTGDISFLDNECTMVMFFNKKLIKENDLEDPYQLVREHKWTIDKVYEMSKSFTQNIGSDAMNNEDKYGLHIAYNAPHSMFFSGGGRITETDNDGKVSLVMNSRQNIDLITKIMNIANSDNVLSNKLPGCDSFESICEMFTNDQVIFTTFALIDMFQFKDAEGFEFGILPYPLANDSQTDYNCLVSTALVPVITISSVAENPNELAAVVDAMAQEAVDTVTPAYYDKVLKLRNLQDKESAEMLDIIFESRAYDIGFISNWGGIGNLIYNMYWDGDANFVSRYEAIESAVNAAMEKSMEDFYS